MDHPPPRIRLNSEVTAGSRRNRDKVKDHRRSDHHFVLTVNGPEETPYRFEAKAVIDASGTWFNPNPLGAGGIKVPGEEKHDDFITYGIPDVSGDLQSEFLGRDVAVVGGGHSAMQVLLDLIKLQRDHPQTKAHWLIRGSSLDHVLGGGEEDELQARGALELRVRNAVENNRIHLQKSFRVQRIDRLKEGENEVVITGGQNKDSKRLKVDRIVGTTGFRPDLDMNREIRTDIDPATEAVKDLAPLIDPNLHSCGTVPPHGVQHLKHPDENFFIAGIKSYGRAPNFLLITGYEQVRLIADYLVGDVEAANDIQLELPETGVCTTDLLRDDEVVENTSKNYSTGSQESDSCGMDERTLPGKISCCDPSDKATCSI